MSDDSLDVSIDFHKYLWPAVGGSGPPNSPLDPPLSENVCRLVRTSFIHSDLMKSPVA